jgi:CheY-like chemotaxis protein
MLALLLGLHFAEAAIDVHYDGMTALAAARNQWPDVVITDLDMPVMTGHDFASALQSLSTTMSRPLLIAVSGGAHQLARATERRMFDHVLPKPIDMGKLLQLLEAER